MIEPKIAKYSRLRRQFFGVWKKMGSPRRGSTIGLTENASARVIALHLFLPFTNRKREATQRNTATESICPQAEVVSNVKGLKRRNKKANLAFFSVPSDSMMKCLTRKAKQMLAAIIGILIAKL